MVEAESQVKKVSLKLLMPVVPEQGYFECYAWRCAIERYHDLETSCLLPLMEEYAFWWNLQVGSLLFRAAEENPSPEAAEDAFQESYAAFMKEDLKKAAHVDVFEISMSSKLRILEGLYRFAKAEADNCQAQFKVSDKDRKAIWELSRPAVYHLFQCTAGKKEISQFAATASRLAAKWQ